jgi:hypothetical protein
MHPTALENNSRVCAYVPVRALSPLHKVSASYLEMQQVVRTQLIEGLLQCSFVWFQQEELFPEAL